MLATWRGSRSSACYSARRNDTGNTPLIWAANAGQTAAVVFLLEAGVVVNHRGFIGNTAIARAAQRGDLSSVQALLSAGVDPNIANEKLQYPLHFAAHKCHPACVRAMLDSGLCDTMVTDRKGRTPAEDTKDAGIRKMIIDAR